MSRKGKIVGRSLETIPLSVRSVKIKNRLNLQSPF